MDSTSSRQALAAGAVTVASGNIGCLTQLQSHLAQAKLPIRGQHTLQVLSDACRGGD